jgi:hypothetical protein
MLKDSEHTGTYDVNFNIGGFQSSEHSYSKLLLIQINWGRVYPDRPIIQINGTKERPKRQKN